MALFNRNKKKDDVLPEEVREYYKTEKRERTGMAWLLALATLFVTFLIAAGLFFGGRWVYRQVFEDKKPPATTQTASESPSDSSANDATGDEADSDSDSNTDETTGTSSTNTTTPSGSGGNSPTGTPAAPGATPSTGPSELVDTGPGDE